VRSCSTAAPLFSPAHKTSATLQNPPKPFELQPSKTLQVNVPHKTDRIILEDASLALRSGRALLVVGRAGEGKSTLIRAIMLQARARAYTLG